MSRLRYGIWLILAALCGGFVATSVQAGTTSSQVVTDSNIANYFPAGLDFTTMVNAGTSFSTTFHGYTFTPMTKADANNSSNGGPSIDSLNYDPSIGSSGANSTYGRGGSGTYPPDGIVSGGFLDKLLYGFVFDDGNPIYGNRVGDVQTYTLSGLTVGVTYDTRLYIRAWENGADGATNGQTSRSNTLSFFSGADSGSITILEDNPSAQTGVPGNPAYFLNYHFTADAPTLTIEAVINPDPNGNSPGPFHLYAITNQVAVPETVVPEAPSLGLLVFGLVLMAAWRRLSGAKGCPVVPENSSPSNH